MCAACKQPIRDAYYSAKGKTFCAGCKAKIEAALAREGNFGRGLLFGLGGAVAGGAVYYGVAAVSGYEIGLIAILVGWLVGRGMQVGAHAVGGRKYQIAAVALTYLAVAGSYTAYALREARSDRTPATRGVAATTRGDSATAANPVLAAKEDGSAATTPPPLRALVTLLGLTLGLPIIVGFSNLPGSALGLVIIGIGLMQAWRMNRKPELEIQGPFQIGSAEPAGGGQSSAP
jgi:hypothetical protein